MTEPTVDSYSDPTRLRQFMKHLLHDVRALEKMIEEGMIEKGIRRIGAELSADGLTPPGPVVTL